MRSPRIIFIGSAAAVSVVLSEDITDESDIVAGGNTITLTLTGDTWESTLGGDNTVTTALIAGLDSDGAEGAGWDAVVKAGLTYTTVTRTSDTVCTVELPAFGSYNITATETITATIPASALTTSGSPVVATPSFTIDAVVTDVFFGNKLHPIHDGIFMNTAAGLSGVLVT